MRVKPGNTAPEGNKVAPSRSAQAATSIPQKGPMSMPATALGRQPRFTRRESLSCTLNSRLMTTCMARSTPIIHNRLGVS